MERHTQLINGEQDMTPDVNLDELGEFGIGEGSIETILDEPEHKRFTEIIRDSFVPVSIFDIISCGDERPGEGTLASSERTAPRPKLFGGIMALYGGLLLVDRNFGRDFVKELKWIDALMEQHGYHLGGHTDTTHAEVAKRYIESHANGEAVDEVPKSACGMVDSIEASFQKMNSHGHGLPYARLLKALRADDYDSTISGQILDGSRRLVGAIPGPMKDWRGGHMLAALASKPDRIEVLTDDNLGVHGHRGAVISANTKYGYTLDRRQVADKVAEDRLLRGKKPNAFNIDAWAIPELTMPLAEYLAASSSDVPAKHKLIQDAVTQLQIATGITLTKGSQRVLAVS